MIYVYVGLWVLITIGFFGEYIEGWSNERKRRDIELRSRGFDSGPQVFTLRAGVEEPFIYRRPVAQLRETKGTVSSKATHTIGYRV